MIKKYVLALASLDFLSLGFVIPVLSRRLISLGGDRFYLGILQSMQSFLQFVTGPLIGSWSDNVGVRKALLFSSYGILLSYIAFFGDYIAFYVIYRILNATLGHTQILVKGLISEYRVPDGLNVMSKLRTLGAASFCFGPIIGGHIASYGFSYLCSGLCFLSICTIVICHSLPPSPKELAKKPAKPTQKKSTNKFKEILKNFEKLDWSIYWDLFALRFLIEVFSSMHYQNLGFMFSVVFQLSAKNVGYVIAFYGLVSTLANTQEKRLRKLTDNPLTVGCFGFLVTFVFIFFYQDFYTYVALVIPFTAFRILLESSWTENLVARTKLNGNKNEVSVTACFDSLHQLAGFLSPVVNGYIGQRFGQNYSVGLCIAISFAATVFSTFTKSSHLKQH